MASKEDWFRLKKYPHVDSRINPGDRDKWVESYVTNSEKIARHSFLPFIHKVKRVRKFRKEYSDKDGYSIKTDGKALRVKGSKPRDLFYAGHLDSLIYSYYSELLSEKYEAKLIENGLDEVVLAYRSIPIHSCNLDGPKKCNIDFANDVFKFIRNYGQESFVVVTFDIEKFFDKLDHKKLNESWCSLLGESTRMPNDHFNVFKSLTRHSYIDLIDIFKHFQNKIIVQDRDTKGRLKTPRRKRVSKIKYLKKENAIAFCTKKEFLSIKSVLIRNTKHVKNENGDMVLRGYGIPQGTSISSVLANAYLLNFDMEINKIIDGLGGIYRRYSDDMLVVFPSSQEDRIIELFKSEISKANLNIQHEKTQVFNFKWFGSKLRCGQKFENKFINWNKNLVYLGFEFNGSVTRLKPASLSSYYRKMKKIIARSKRYSGMPGPNRGKLFKRSILKRYSYKGANRRRSWVYDSKVDGFVKSERYDWGNYLAYAQKAARTMTSNKIKGQYKSHWNKLNKLIKVN